MEYGIGVLLGNKLVPCPKGDIVVQMAGKMLAGGPLLNPSTTCGPKNGVSVRKIVMKVKEPIL